MELITRFYSNVFSLLLYLLAAPTIVRAQPSNHPPVTRVLTFEIVDDWEEKVDREVVIENINEMLRDRARARLVGENQIAVDVFGDVNEPQLNLIRFRLGVLGQLKFRITADPAFESDKPIIDLALKLPPERKEVERFGRTVAEWVAYSEEEFGAPDKDDPRIVKRLAGKSPEALILIDFWNVKGEYLRWISKGTDDLGRPAVNLSFNRQGAARLRKLTSRNLPNPTTGARRYLGIVLDKRLFAAPSIETTVSESVQISGRTMTDDEVDSLIEQLRNSSSLMSFLREISNEKVAE